MLRLVSLVLLAFGLVMAGASSASAEPVPNAGAVKAVPGKKVCKIGNPVLSELSGMVATKRGYVVINDGVDSSAGQRVFFLDGKCKVTGDVAYPTIPRDPEDLALSRDGKTLWIGDIGDNARGGGERRKTVAVWSMPADGSKKPVIHRVAYPDGPRDAEALLVNDDGTIIVVTKEPGKAGLYVPTGPLKKNNQQGVPMRRAGEVKLPPTTTPNPLSGAGRLIVTGGAVSPDGTRVVLRTYADAFEWDTKNGDIISSMKAQPRVTPLPDEPFGEAITYTPDGSSFLTVSDMGEYDDEDTPNHILRYTPATQVAEPAGTQPQKKSTELSWFDKLSLQDITYLIIGVGVLGGLLVTAGVIGIMRARRRPPKSVTVSSSSAAPPASDPASAGVASGPEGANRDRWPAAAGEYRSSGAPAGGVPAGPGQTSGVVYGGGGVPSAGRPPNTGSVYGAPNAGSAAPPKGSTYGGASAPGRPPAVHPGGMPGGHPVAGHPADRFGPAGGPPPPGVYGAGNAPSGPYGYAEQSAAGRRGTPRPEPGGYPDDYDFEQGIHRP
jgi:hypothetical protein